MYKKIICHHGVIMEFGVRWGPITNLFQSLRGIYEPFNKHRKVIGFVIIFQLYDAVNLLFP